MRRFIVHPILLALFPVLFLYSRNAEQFPLGVILLPALVLLGATAIIWTCAGLAFRSAHKGATLASLTVLLSFSYGMCISSLRATWNNETWEGPGCALGIALATLLVAGTLLIRKMPEHIDRFLKVENFAAACLLVVPLISIAGSQLRRTHIVMPAWTYRVPRPSPTSAAYPDVYYIVLDGYAGADILRDIYGYDNSEFLNYLASKGFVVASKSRSNYCQTGLSLASSLNMDYLDAYTVSVKPKAGDRTALTDLVTYSAARRFFADHGYSFTVFTSNYYLTDLKTADQYMGLRSLNEFQGGIVNMTPLAAAGLSFRAHRERIDYAFAHLADPSMDGTRSFVLAHITAPHPPFVFNAEGNDVTPHEEYSMADGSKFFESVGVTWKEYRDGYVAQLAYVNKRVEQTVDGILKHAVEPPIIVIQGDHGPGSLMDQESAGKTYLNERFSILNAYYFPGGAPPEIYDSISPVNTFRVILNHCFGTDYKLLRDDCYFATWSEPYKYIPATKAMEEESLEKAARLQKERETARIESRRLPVRPMRSKGARPRGTP